MTLIWPTGCVWANFSGGTLELSRGETLRVYPKWSGW